MLDNSNDGDGDKNGVQGQGQGYYGLVPQFTISLMDLTNESTEVMRRAGGEIEPMTR